MSSHPACGPRGWHARCTSSDDLAAPDPSTGTIMNNFFRTLIAGFGAWKLGGGCVSTVLIFVVLFWLLGYC
jgi:hypothetical protein